MLVFAGAKFTASYSAQYVYTELLLFLTSEEMSVFFGESLKFVILNLKPCSLAPIGNCLSAIVTIVKRLITTVMIV